MVTRGFLAEGGGVHVAVKIDRDVPRRGLHFPLIIL